MKIDDAYKAMDVYAATRANQTDKVDKPGVTRAGGPAVSGSDAVQVSDEARLRAEAVKAAEDAPAIRPEVVARGKALLESGQLGKDPAALAESLINALLDQPGRRD